MKGTVVKHIIFLCGLSCAFSSDWTYKGDKGPDKWKNLDGYSACGGEKQSPINIDSSKAEYMESLGKFSFTGYDTLPTGMKLVNNGHTAKVSLEGDIKISGGGLSGDYKAAQYHFHWGSSDSKGSEHTINNKQFPMEVHIVHYSSQYSTLGDAVDKSNGLAVLGFMFEISGDDNPNLNKLISDLGDVKNKGGEVEMDRFTLDSFLPSDRDSFFRYEGSLTTPGCQETVVWTVFTEKIQISKKQMDAFRQLNMKEQDNTDKIVDNFRPVQPLGSRMVYSSMETSSAIRLTSGLSFVFFTSLIVALIFRH